MIELTGILIVALGFALRLNPLLSVLAAGSVTGLIAGYSLAGILDMLGRFFIDNRFMTLPVILMMPVVGLLEKYGLQERAALLIRRAGGASAGRVLWLYQVMREGFSTLGLNVGGHASMVRPLIAPMAEGAAQARRSGTARGHSPAGEATGPAKLPAHGSGSAVPGHSPAREVTAPVPLPPSLSADVRRHAAASENIGNFFADDILVAVGPVLLMKGVFDLAGVPVEILHLAWWAAPTALFVLVVGWWRFRLLDRRLAAPSPPRATVVPGTRMEQP